jgi:catechol 2,3-dioxygenase-like lactoylglutathione lyase family enzyme
MEHAATPPRIERLARIGLITPDAGRLCRFYERVLGFSRLGASDRFVSDVGAHGITLGLGREAIELLQFDHPGRRYPDDIASSDLRFQHFAIVVSDMALAYRRLCADDSWTAISTDGPQRLPPSSGGVDAFKFRDLDGHPLELLAFPTEKTPACWQQPPNDELFLGIDHSAIGVADSRRSITFYHALGLSLAARSHNAGGAQQRLDDVNRPQVEVTALAPPRATPHVELLCYRSVTHERTPGLRYNDVAATRLIFETREGPSENLVDPDGHHLVIVSAANAASSHAANPANADMLSVSVKPETTRWPQPTRP